MRRAALILLVIAFGASNALAQSPDVASDDGSGQANFDQIHEAWPAPEKLVAELRSADDATRRNALRLLGVPEPTSTKHEIEQPDGIELRYATLEEGDDQQAIIAVSIDLAYVYAAVAVQSQKGWQRIATFSCWCKYEKGDLLAGFVHVEYGVKGFDELVVRGSSGGTGLYDRGEEHFRVHGGELREILSFAGYHRNCDPQPPQNGDCKVERRWFYSGDSRGVLVESLFVLPLNGQIEPESYVEDLGTHRAKSFWCTEYSWDQKKFQYTKSSARHACRSKEVW